MEVGYRKNLCCFLIVCITLAPCKMYQFAKTSNFAVLLYVLQIPFLGVNISP